jgi:hypothetical protein
LFVLENSKRPIGRLDLGRVSVSHALTADREVFWPPQSKGKGPSGGGGSGDGPSGPKTKHASSSSSSSTPTAGVGTSHGSSASAIASGSASSDGGCPSAVSALVTSSDAGPPCSDEADVVPEELGLGIDISGLIDIDEGCVELAPTSTDDHSEFEHLYAATLDNADEEEGLFPLPPSLASPGASGKGVGVKAGSGPKGSSSSSSKAPPFVPYDHTTHLLPPVFPKLATRKWAETAEHAIEVNGGTITYYDAGQRFVATCRSGHGRCVLERGIHADNGCLGRPVGLMLSWLSCGHLCSNKAEHWDPVYTIVPRSVRRDLRLEFVSTGSPVVLALLSKELGDMPDPSHEAFEPPFAQ